MYSPESFMEEQLKALDEARAVHGPTHRKVAEVLSVIALYHQHATHDLDTALEYHHQALAVLESHHAERLQQQQQQLDQKEEEDDESEKKSLGENGTSSSSRCEGGDVHRPQQPVSTSENGDIASGSAGPSSSSTPKQSQSQQKTTQQKPSKKSSTKSSSSKASSSKSSRHRLCLVEIAVTLTDIGNVLRTMDDVPGALAAYRRALALFEGAATDGSVSKNHPSILAAARGIAMLERRGCSA